MHVEIFVENIFIELKWNVCKCHLVLRKTRNRLSIAAATRPFGEAPLLHEAGVEQQRPCPRALAQQRMGTGPVLLPAVNLSIWLRDPRLLNLYHQLELKFQVKTLLTSSTG